MSKYRLLADPYDSGEQPRYTGWDAREEEFCIFLGRMRLDTILYDKVVLNDASIFEGVFFLDAANNERLSDLPWANIEIRARASAFRDCIVQWFSRPERKTLVPVYHPSLSKDCNVAELSLAIGQQNSINIASIETYVEMLKYLNVPGAIADRQLNAWQKLEQFLRDTGVPLTPWGRAFGYERHLSISRNYASNAMRTPLGYETFRKVWEDRRLRSSVYADLDHARSVAGPEELSDIETINTWYNYAYKSAQAHENNCDSVEILVSNLCRPYNETELPIGKTINELKTEEKIEVPPEFLHSLGKIPKFDFERLTANVISSGIADWRRNRIGNASRARDALRSAMETLAETIQGIVPFHYSGESEPTLNKFVDRTTAAAVAALALETIERHKKRNTAAALLTRRKLFSVGAKTAIVTGIGILAGNTVGELLRPQSANERIAEAIVRMEDTRQFS